MTVQTDQPVLLGREFNGYAFVARYAYKGKRTEFIAESPAEEQAQLAQFVQETDYPKAWPEAVISVPDKYAGPIGLSPAPAAQPKPKRLLERLFSRR